MSNKNKDSPENIFNKDFEHLSRTHNFWNIWCDFIEMCAISISNSVDRSNRHSIKEQQYLKIAKNYSKEELYTFAHMFAQLVLILEKNQAQDFLGKFYMNHKFGSNNKGQFFTPWYIAGLMSRISIDKKEIIKAIEEKGYASICDPACGSGVTLLASANSIFTEYKINYQQNIIFVAQDIDPIVAKMCYIQLSLNGCAGYVIIGNSLTAPITGNLLFPNEYPDIWYTPMWFSDIWKQKRANVIAKKMMLDNKRIEKKPPIKQITQAKINTKSRKSELNIKNALIRFFGGKNEKT